MSSDRERTVVVATTPTAFHAETIATALRERGLDARVLDAATTQIWGMPMGPSGGVKVVVLEHEADRAKIAIEDVRAESAGIDWDTVDLGDDPEVRRLVQYSKARRWVWTVALLLVPGGLFVMWAGVTRSDYIVKIIGGTMLAAALVMSILQTLPERRADDEGD